MLELLLLQKFKQLISLTDEMNQQKKAITETLATFRIKRIPHKVPGAMNINEPNDSRAF
jgi:hypothetical protein